MMVALDQYRDQSPYIKGQNGEPLKVNPFKDKRVRQALSLAVNRDALVKSVMREEKLLQHKVWSQILF